MAARAVSLRSLLTAPFTDLLDGLDRTLAGKASRLAVVFLGLAVGWWIYVPIHELLHVAGCLVTGGEVSRLEVAPEYGGALLARLFPFVVAGGDYAGRLAGFDDHGSFWIHAATVLGPYLLTIFPGVWALLWAGDRSRPLLFGISLPVAYAPFMGLVGDAYELGSLVIVELPWWHDGRLVSDDLILLAGGGHGRAGWLGIALGVVVALAWAWSTYGLGRLLATRAIGGRGKGLSD
jgi:hypothetical protein